MVSTWLGRIAAFALAATAATTPASAQFFWKAPDLTSPAVRGDEPTIGFSLPGATPAELRAGVLWNMRTGLNVAALQCQFDPTLLTLNQYNHLINHHRVELAEAYQTLLGYFRRIDRRQGQANFDKFGDRTYNGFSTVAGQLTFCATAAQVGRQALFAPRGELYRVAQQRLLELRRSLLLGGEQQFPAARVPPVQFTRVLGPDCFDRRDRLRRQCGGRVR